ncbi:MAG: hypothetical protein IGR93_15470 [Hydrococcus sp. C42_A2020_068]|nr:hypothetical protein [Hydrococcus sp. C42_A2020_068]
MQRAKPMRRQVLAIVVGLVLALGVGYLKQRGIAIGFGSQPVAAQTMRPESVAATVYQRLPNLPKENQYLRRDTGKVDEQNTLITRLVRYHQDLKKRQTNFRLDWKLTLADYLGVNEPIKPDRYPGQSSLKTNPMENDVKAIRHLNRRQRDELVDALVSAYKANEPNPPTPNVNPNSNSSPKPAPQSPSVPSSSSPSMSKPGDSQLLQP